MVKICARPAADRRYTSCSEIYKPTQIAVPGGDEFSKYLTSAPPTPNGAPQTVSEFLSRVVAYDEGLSATVITTQQLTTTEPGVPLTVIDVDAFCAGEFSMINISCFIISFCCFYLIIK